MQDILKEFHSMVEDKVRGRHHHTAAAPIVYGYQYHPASASVSGTSSGGKTIGTSRTGAYGHATSGHPEVDADEDGDNVDAMQDAGYFARYGEPQPENRGEHAGTYHGIRRVPPAP